MNIRWNSVEIVPLHVSSDTDFDILLEVYSTDGDLLEVCKTSETSEQDGTVSVRVWVTGAKLSPIKCPVVPLEIETYLISVYEKDQIPDNLSVISHERHGKTLRVKVARCQ